MVLLAVHGQDKQASEEQVSAIHEVCEKLDPEDMCAGMMPLPVGLLAVCYMSVGHRTRFARCPAFCRSPGSQLPSHLGISARSTLLECAALFCPREAHQTHMEQISEDSREQRAAHRCWHRAM
jgi:hypothetical protein